MHRYRPTAVRGTAVVAVVLASLVAWWAPALAGDEPRAIFFGCDGLVTFDASSEGWRNISTTGGFTVNVDYGTAGWTATEGNPGGAIVDTDRDGQWQELWTPLLEENGYATDYSFAIGGSLQFDYRNDTGIEYDVYVALWGANGHRYFFNFRPQIVDSTQWTRIQVPMEASAWQTGFSQSTGPQGAAPSEVDFAAALADVDSFAFSIEGRSGSDTTFFDNFGTACGDDFGDAPASYGTLLADDGPRHRLPIGTTQTASLMLGASVDLEDDGLPSTDAGGDDLDGLDDEDGVAAPIIVSHEGSSAVSLTVTNGTDAVATLAGWIDLDGNGTFDPGERVVETVPAASGSATYVLTFPAATTEQGTFARFRLFPGAVGDPSPTGQVIGGEVEDHLVSVLPVPGDWTAQKSSDAGGPVAPGDVVTYTITLTNTGTTTLDDPLALPSIQDDLTDVLDDATYNDDADAGGIGELAYAQPMLVWRGSLAVGQSVTITYSVTVNTVDALGDRQLINAVVGALNCEDPEADAGCTAQDEVLAGNPPAPGDGPDEPSPPQLPDTRMTWTGDSGQR